MNDPLESRLFFQMLRDAAIRRETSENAQRLREFLKNYQLNLKDYFLACFSSSEDRLSQWMMYADNGHGVALGFRPEQLCNHFRVPVLGRESLGIFRVNYDSRGSKQLATDLVDLVLDGTFGALSPSVEQHALTVKDSGFREEDEIRLAEVQSLDWNLNPDFQGLRTSNPASKLKFRTGSGRDLIPYREHGIATVEGDLEIYSIVLGPKCAIDLRSLELFLEKNNVVIESGRLAASAIPFA